MNSRNAALLLLVLIVVSVIGGRLYARKSAADFGGSLSGAFSTLNYEGFADTEGLREHLSSPEMRKYPDIVNRFSILGGGYDERIREVQSGMIYLSEQLALPQEKRFAKPLALRHFRIAPESTSDRGVFDAAGKLILDYRWQIL